MSEIEDRLRQINRVAAAAHRGVMEKVDVHKNEREQLQRMYDDKRLPDHARQEIKKTLDNPKLHQQREVVNQEEAKKMESHVESIIKREIKTGRLEDPSRSVDKFMKGKWK